MGPRISSDFCPLRDRERLDIHSKSKDWIGWNQDQKGSVFISPPPTPRGNTVTFQGEDRSVGLPFCCLVSPEWERLFFSGEWKKEGWSNHTLRNSYVRADLKLKYLQKISDWRCQGDTKGQFVLLSPPNLLPQKATAQQRSLICHVNYVGDVSSQLWRCPVIIIATEIFHQWMLLKLRLPLPTVTTTSSLTDDGMLGKPWWHRYGKLEPIPSIICMVSTIEIKLEFSRELNYTRGR